MIYPCGQCEYQATRKDNLDQHKRSVHKGIKKIYLWQFEYQQQQKVVRSAYTVGSWRDVIKKKKRLPCHEPANCSRFILLQYDDKFRFNDY